MFTAPDDAPMIRLVQLEGDFQRYDHGMSNRGQAKVAPKKLKELQKRWDERTEERPSRHLTKPAVLIDKHGVVMAWYLPDALNQSTQVSSLTIQTVCIHLTTPQGYHAPIHSRIKTSADILWQA